MQIKGKLKEANQYEEVEELRTKRADKQSILLLDAFNKDRASLPQPLPNPPPLAPLPVPAPDPRTQEMINEKLKKAEDLAPYQTGACSGFLKIHAADVHITDQKLQVCDICGAFLSVYDRYLVYPLLPGHNLLS
ncbi:hypothetical protein SLA2020_065840 [Shorea laevis]